MDQQRLALRLKIFHESSYIHRAAPLWSTHEGIEPDQTWNHRTAEADWQFFRSSENQRVVPYCTRLFDQIKIIILSNHTAAVLSPSPYVRKLAQLIKQ